MGNRSQVRVDVKVGTLSYSNGKPLASPSRCEGQNSHLLAPKRKQGVHRALKSIRGLEGTSAG
jgi:hypothetical protein